MDRLSAEAFEGIVKGLRSDTRPFTNEKRSEPRVGLRAKIDIIPRQGENAGVKPRTVWLRDLSSRGIGLVSSQSMAKGMEFTAVFPREREGLLQEQYVVIYCKAISADLFIVGARLKNAVVPATNGPDQASASAPDGLGRSKPKNNVAKR